MLYTNSSYVKALANRRVPLHKLYYTISSRPPTGRMPTPKFFGNNLDQLL